MFEDTPESMEPSPLPPAENVVILQPVKADEVGKRGRPRSKVRPDEVKTGGAPKIPSLPLTDDEKEKQRKLKQARINNTQAIIVNDLNEAIISGIASLGIPAQFLYKTGHPKVEAVNTNYTDLAALFCINSSQANWIARGWIEAQEIPAVKRVVGTPKEGPSYLWIVLGGFGALSYVTQLSRAIKMLKEIKETLERVEVNTPSNEPPINNGPSFAEA